MIVVVDESGHHRSTLVQGPSYASPRPPTAAIRPTSERTPRPRWSLGDHCRTPWYFYFDHLCGPCRLFTRNEFCKYAASPHTGNVSFEQHGLQGPEVGSAHKIMLGGDYRFILELEGRLKSFEYGLCQMVIIGSMG